MKFGLENVSYLCASTRNRRSVGGLAAGAVIGGGYYGGGYYGGPYAYDGGCYIQRRAFINRFGHRVIRRVRVCD
jgi:hypothetical protein